MQELTTSPGDSILSGDIAAEFDPVLEYALLGDSVSDGVLAWVYIGVDMTLAKVITPAAKYTSSGGVMTDSTSSATDGGQDGQDRDFSCGVGALGSIEGEL